MKPVYRAGLIILFLLHFFLASWYVRQADIVFTADIGRDFWLLEELAEKKLVLIGPRASGELYHGPVWTYINLPAFLVGSGDPVIVGWWWILLAVAATAGNFLIAKKLFGPAAGWAFALMSSLYYTFHTRGMSHPHGAMFILPFWFFLFVRYLQTRRPLFLAAHLLLSGLLIQLELAVGIPYAGLSGLALFSVIVKKRNFRHLLYLGIVPLTLVNFVIFDLRHDHLLFNKLLDFVGPHQEGELFNYAKYIGQRLWLLFSGPEILRRDPGYRNLGLMLVTLLLTVFQIRKNKHRVVYTSFLYLYAGFFALSFVDKGPILYFHLYPQFPLVFLVFSSFVASQYRRWFIPLFTLVYIFNVAGSVGDVQSAAGFIGKDRESWKALRTVAESVALEREAAFGYFVFSPDITGYAPKYAVRHILKKSGRNAQEFTKLPVTYLVLSPPPRNNPTMTGTWWRKNQLGIAGEPETSKTFESGFVVERYILSPEEQAVPFDPALDPGLHFR